MCNPEWQLVIAVSLKVGGGVHLIFQAKLYMCMQNTTAHTEVMCLIWFCTGRGEGGGGLWPFIKKHDSG